MSNRKLKPITAAVGTAFVATLAVAGVASADNPFQADEVELNQQLLAFDGDKGESQCGESECGESECGESECGESECGESECGESECGESECGA